MVRLRSVFGLNGLWGAAFLLAVALPQASEANISNTASATYSDLSGKLVTIQSNAVIVAATSVSPLPAATSPVVTGINPTAVTAGDPATTVILSGTNVPSDAAVYGAGGMVFLPLSTTQTGVTFTLPSQVIATVGTYSVFLKGGSGFASNSIDCFIVAPPSVSLGGTEITLTTDGTLPLQQAIGNSFSWSWQPIVGTAATIKASAESALSVAAHLITSSPQLSLASLHLPPGLYDVTVTATNQAGRTSAPVHARVNLVASQPGTLSVYPNPWRSDRHRGRKIVFNGLASGSTVSIYSASGRKVKELSSDQMPIAWDLTNSQGDAVASGIYLYLVREPGSGRTRGKLAILR